MKNGLIAIVVVVAVVALAVFVYRGMKSVVDRGRAISDDVITRYVGHIKAGRYDEAWSGCLSDGYRKGVTLAEFSAAHDAHKQDHGALKGWRQIDYQHEANLFTDESLIGINAVLEYENRDVFVLYKVDSAVLPYRIVQIFGSPGRSDSLSEGIW